MLMSRYLELESLNDLPSRGQLGSPNSSTVAAHTKMRLLSKVEHNMRQSQGHQQANNINNLIHTADAGNGVVGDVDGLLTPMRIKAHMSPPHSGGGGGGSSSSGGGGNSSIKADSRPERNLWSRAEMLEMLSIMQNINALEQLNDRNVKSEHVFRQIEDIMRSKGYVKKSSIQIWTKWKFLKSTYNTTTRHGTGIPKVVPEEVYRVLCRMLRNGAGGADSNGNTSDCGNSMDSSKTHSDEVKDDMLGVEHPIFGFRLGLVKPEPLDTGYESVLTRDNMTEQDSETSRHYEPSIEVTHPEQEEVNHLPFIVSVKHEPDMDLGMDGTNTPPPTAPASPSPPPSASLEHVYTSTPSTMPPLRVASFAKDELRRPPHGVLRIDRPPPTLTKGPAALGRLNRSLPLQSTSNINFVHPTSKLMLPRKQQHVPPMRLPREISLQPAGMRLKPVPIRETGYSLRPDRMIPDLEQSNSPPQSPSPTHIQPMPTLLTRAQPQKYGMSPYIASTSRQALLLSHQQQHQQQRKRRLAQSSPVPVKLQRSGPIYESPSKHSRSPNFEDEEVMLEAKRKKINEESQPSQHEEIFTKELSQLASAMRSAQKEMLEDFFKQQKEFARREHEFQLKQDTLVMRALRRQTDALLRTANELIDGEANSTLKVIPPEEAETEFQDVEQIMASTLIEEEDQEEDQDEEEEEEGEEISSESDLEMSTLAMSASALSEYDSNNDGPPSNSDV